jgi:hypothetical protein
MRIRKHQVAFVVGVAAAAMAIACAPTASARPNVGVCSDAGGSVDCLGQGNQQVFASPRPLPRVFPPSINPRWRDIGYSARFPKYGFDPKWQAFGYNPLYSGFQPRPSVLKPFRLSGFQDTPPPAAGSTDTGGSTIYQTAGHAQVTAQIGMAARYATQAQYPSPARSGADDDGAPTMTQSSGHAAITAKPGPAAQSAAGQAAFFPVPDLPTA